MLLSTVIQLEAVADATLEQFTGSGIHGFWFKHWHDVNPDLGDKLHDNSHDSPFAVSPLMGIPDLRGKPAAVKAGQPAWFRVATLTDALSQATREQWSDALEIGCRIDVPAERVEGERLLPGVGWKVIAKSGHSFEFEIGYDELARRHLMNPKPPHQWKIELLTPTTFHRSTTHLPFPQPELLIGSWLRRWQAFAPIALPEEELMKWARENLAVITYHLRTVRAIEGERMRGGCVGIFTLRAVDTPPYLRAGIDLLVAYAFFCGSGAHTGQGLGQTRCIAIL